MKLFSALLLLFAFVSVDPGVAQSSGGSLSSGSLVGSWEGLLDEEEGASVVLDLGADGSCEMVVEVALEDTFLFRTTYLGVWSAAADSLHLDFAGGEIAVNEVLVGEALPLLLVGIIAGLQEWLTGEEITEEELAAAVNEIKEDIEAGLAAKPKHWPRSFPWSTSWKGTCLPCAAWTTWSRWS